MPQGPHGPWGQSRWMRGPVLDVPRCPGTTSGLGVLPARRASPRWAVQPGSASIAHGPKHGG